MEENEAEEVVEAIYTIRNYCKSRFNCDYCDEAVRKWCDSTTKEVNLPFEWECE